MDQAPIVADLRLRVAELERVVSHLVNHLGMQVPAAGPSVSPTVRQFLAAGDRLGAMRQHVHETGVSLHEAKALIESLS